MKYLGEIWIFSREFDKIYPNYNSSAALKIRLSSHLSLQVVVNWIKFLSKIYALLELAEVLQLWWRRSLEQFTNKRPAP